MEPGELASWFSTRTGIGALLDWRSDAENPRFMPISHHPDQVVTVTRGYGDASKPEDFLDSFAAFVRDNINTIAALKVVIQRPRDLTRSDLKELRLALDRKGYSDANLRRAWADAKNEEIAASIIGFVRQAAIGDPLIPYDDRVRAAMRRVLASRTWTEPQKRWLKRIGEQVEKEIVIDREAIDREPFVADGGFARLNKKVFGGELENVLAGINEEMWKKAGLMTTAYEHCRQALVSLPRPAGRRRNLQRVCDRADLFVVPQDAGGNEARKPPARLFTVGQSWLGAMDSTNLIKLYKRLLSRSQGKPEGQGRNLVRAIFTDAQTRLRKPTNLKALTTDIDKLDWFSAREEGLGNLYEGLLEKNASDKKSGAGQYFTPRPLIDSIVRLMRPQAGEIVQDPAAGTAGFLVASDHYIKARTDDLYKLPEALVCSFSGTTRASGPNWFRIPTVYA